MIAENKPWKSLFWVCFGLAAGTAFCMKWMEADFWQNGEKFTIIGLELSYPEEKLASTLSGLNDHVKTILRYHLSFDFAFMAGIYPGIAALCMLGRERSDRPGIRKLLLGLAFLQSIAWGCDIAENIFLLKWTSNPLAGKEFGVYHFVVYTKWLLALTGALLGILFNMLRKKQHR
ncbi:MAG: hypothetical protein ABIT05_03840 [Chitinophagaceae bacterium]